MIGQPEEEGASLGGWKESFLSNLGDGLEVYFKLKKQMTPNVEPPAVRKVRTALRSLVFGSGACGAGGGGCLVAVTRRPAAAIRQELKRRVEAVGLQVQGEQEEMLQVDGGGEKSSSVRFFHVGIDEEGTVINGTENTRLGY
eukprot:GHVS01000669.1.p2 GENE.GHVS01000669.1~~GHVS01000669.1.p2  ORF type:complete len:142 (+),score=30.84 GHVS01000669.1:378-803(+)